MTDSRLSPEDETALRKCVDLPGYGDAMLAETARKWFPVLLAELDVLREELRGLRAALEAITDEELCSFDHHGGCQAHMFLDLEHEECPMKVAQDLLGVRDV